ncbi:hypothetical protein AHAS_Ahas12G0088500 [Arachis hypogaea]
MPLSIMEKLGIIEVQAARISLEMADNSKNQAYGLVEDVLVKVEGHYIPADFIILETGKCMDESIILGRPFLATAKAVINVDRGELIIQVNGDSLVFKAQGYPSVTMERKHEELLSIHIQTEPPQSNSKFGVGRFQHCSEHP